MRIRSAIITAVAGLALVGASASAAHANTPPAPKCCGGIQSSPTTQPPKPGDKIKQPTTTTTMKPLKANPVDPDPTPKPNVDGPDGLSDAPKDPVVDPKPDNGPKGPDGLAPAPKCGDCNDGGGVDPGQYGNGSGSEPDGGKGIELGHEGNGTDGGSSVDTSGDPSIVPAAQTTDGDSTETAARSEAHDGSNMSAFLMIFGALLTAGLIGLVVFRMRRDDEDAETI